MQVDIFDNAALLGRATAKKILDLVKAKPNAVLCLPSGATPKLTHQYIVEWAKKEAVDFSGVQFISLDEWVGIPRTNSGSGYYFVNETIFKPLGIKESNIHFFSGVAADLTAECEMINRAIQKLDGIDLVLIGIGLNGHIGFNEPGVSPNLRAHVIDLDAITLQTGQSYFSGTVAIQKGMTLGIAQIMEARTAILLASGLKKADIIKKAVEEKPSNAVPATLLQQHRNAFILLDKDAASMLH